jgi:hypothetical protein
MSLTDQQPWGLSTGEGAEEQPFRRALRGTNHYATG